MAIYWMLQSLKLSDNREFKTIDKDTFSNSKNLTNLDLSFNNLSELDPELFSSLSNFEKLKLENFKLRHFDIKIIDYIVNIKVIHLNFNSNTNIDEVSNRFKQSKIKFYDCFFTLVLLIFYFIETIKVIYKIEFNFYLYYLYINNTKLSYFFLILAHQKTQKSWRLIFSR